MVRPVLLLAFSLGLVTHSGAYECPIGDNDVLQVTEWSAARVDDEWTRTVATLQNASAADVLPPRIGRLFIDGPNLSGWEMAGMIVVEDAMPPGGVMTITVQGTGLSYLASADQSTTSLHACMQ